MAATYEAISREDWEDWLDKAWGRGKWDRSPRHVGVYILHLSKNVGVYISTSISGDDTARDVGKGAMHFKMVSRINDRPLATKALKAAIGKIRWNRAGNWRKTIEADLSKIKRYYEKSAEFFDRIALESKDSDQRQKVHDSNAEIVGRIEAIPGWRDHDILQSFRQQASRGRDLSEKQMAVIENIEKQQQQYGRRPDWRPGVHERDDYLAKMRELWKKVNREQRDYINEMGQNLKHEGVLPAAEKAYLDEGMRKHRVASENTAVKVAAKVEGKIVHVGDWVGFKSDTEQEAQIVKIRGDQLTVQAPPEGFEGSYIGRQDFYTLSARECWLVD